MTLTPVTLGFAMTLSVALLSGCSTAPNPQSGTLASLDFDQVSWVAVAGVLGKSNGGEGDVLGYERVTDWATLDIPHRQELASIIHAMLRAEIAKNSQPGAAPQKTLGLAAMDFTPNLVVRMDTPYGVRYVFLNSSQLRLCVCDTFGNSWLEAFDKDAGEVIASDLRATTSPP